MTILGKRIVISTAAAFLLVGIAAGAHGQVASGGLSSFGGELRGIT